MQMWFLCALLQTLIICSACSNTSNREPTNRPILRENPPLKQEVTRWGFQRSHPPVATEGTSFTTPKAKIRNRLSCDRCLQHHLRKGFPFPKGVPLKELALRRLEG